MVQLATSVIRTKCAIVCGSLILVLIPLVSCNHVNKTNVNSSTSTANVSPPPQDQASLKAKVAALENQPLGPSNLGVSAPFDSSIVTEIIAEGENAAPFLVEAFKQENKPILVGYAVYCLRRIKTDKGKAPAIQLYKKFYRKRTRLSGEEPFAFNQLTHYLIEISAVPGDMRPPGLNQ